MATQDEVLTYWFGTEPITQDAVAMKKVGFWFMGGPDVDREITERFGALLERARRGELDLWASAPRGRLALVILLDQFSRNVYRGKPLAFTQDTAAQKLVLDGIAAGIDKTLPTVERMFFYIPLEHAENVALQDRGVEMFDAMANDAPATLGQLMGIAKNHARQHRDTVVRFGRFPQRNAAMGRTSTPDEAAFLEEQEQKKPKP
jgi:uncharacterized protein (DUF924 family)